MSAQKRLFQWRDQYDVVRDEVEGELAAIAGGGEVITEQQHAFHQDINTLVERFRIGELPMPEPLSAAVYADLSNAPDLRQILEKSKDAADRFAQFPAKLRKRFNDDPVEMYEFVMDPRNADEAVALGLLMREAPPVVPEPQRVTIVDPEGSEGPKRARKKVSSKEDDGGE